MDYIKCSVGDEFKFVGKRGHSGCGSFDSESGAVYIRVTEITDNGYPTYSILDINKKKIDWCGGCLLRKSQGNLFIKVGGVKITNIMSSLINAFRLSRTPEPQKSFIKAGITEENGDFTAEGNLLFNGFLLGKFGQDFKKEVVDPILEEAAKESK